MTIVKPSSSLIVRQCTSCHHQTFQQWQRRVCWQGLEPREHWGSQTLQRSSFHSSISHCPFHSWTWTIMCFSLWDGDLASHVLMFLPLRSQCRKLAEALLFLSVSLMISFRWIFNLFWPLERWFHPWYLWFQVEEPSSACPQLVWAKLGFTNLGRTKFSNMFSPLWLY